jgi:hypothetical protein
MLSRLLTALLGCSHRRTTFPLTPTRKSGRTRETYVVCLDCGTEFEYDWQEMRIQKLVKVIPQASVQAEPVPDVPRWKITFKVP